MRKRNDADAIYVKSRYIPEKTRERLLALFRLACPICGYSFQVHIHHIKYFSMGGQHNIRNLIPLCPNCHSQVHALNISSAILQRIRDRWVKEKELGRLELKLITHLKRCLSEIENGERLLPFYIDQMVNLENGKKTSALSATQNWLSNSKPGDVLIVHGGVGQGKTSYCDMVFSIVSELYLKQGGSEIYPFVVDISKCQTISHVQGILETALFGSGISVCEVPHERLSRSLLLLDGFDEATNDKRLIASHAAKFIPSIRASGLRCIILSRTNYITREKDPAVIFGKPVTLDDFLSNGLTTSKAASVWELSGFTNDQISLYLKQSKYKNYKKIEKWLSSVAAVYDLAKNPLLLKMAATLYGRGPYREDKLDRISIYRAFLTQWLKYEAIVKKRITERDALALQDLFTDIASFLFRNEKQLVSEGEIRSLLHKRREVIGFSNDLETFSTAAELSGFLQVRSEGNWAFKHLSFQEYLAATVLYKELCSRTKLTSWGTREIPPSVVEFLADMMQQPHSIIRLHKELEASPIGVLRRNAAISLQSARSVYQERFGSALPQDVYSPKEWTTLGATQRWETLAHWGWCGQSRERAVIQDVLKSETNARLVRVALLALGFFGNREDFDLIVHTSRTWKHDEMIGGACVFALAFLPGDDARRFTRSCLNKSRYRVTRRAAAWSIEEAYDKGAINALMKALKGDAEPEVREYCAKALAKLGNLDLCEILFHTYTNESNARVREALLRTIFTIAGAQSGQFLVRAEERESDGRVLGAIKILMNNLIQNSLESSIYDRFR